MSSRDLDGHSGVRRRAPFRAVIVERTTVPANSPDAGTAMDDLRREIQAAFRWIDGHADIWAVWADGSLFASLGPALAEPFRNMNIDVVVAVESRGFIIGSLVAAQLGAGLVAVRKDNGLLPGPRVSRTTARDYRGNTPTLRLQSDRVTPGARVLLADDWAETGSQLAAAAAMLQDQGAEVVGTALVVSELRRIDPALGLVHSLIRAEELA